MFNRIAVVIFSLTLSIPNSLLEAHASKKKIPQEGYVSNYGPLQNLWRMYNYTTGHNRKNEILEAIKNSDKESFKKNFMEGDLVNQTDIVIEIIVQNKLELLKMLDEEWNFDIKGIVKKHAARKKSVTYEIPHQLVENHGSKAIPMLYYLHKCGVEIDVKNENGETIAHSIKDKTLLGAIEKYIDLNTRNNQGETPLLVATKDNNIEKVKMLTAAQADVNIGDNEGTTPGHIAASGKCSPACAKIIFEADMDPKAANAAGITVRKTLGNTRNKICLKSLVQVDGKQSYLSYKANCTTMTAIEKFFTQGCLKRLELKIKKLKDEKALVIDLEVSLNQQLLEQKRQQIEEQIARLEKQKLELESQESEEKLNNEKAELQHYVEFEEMLNEECVAHENSSIVPILPVKEDEKSSDDSH